MYELINEKFIEIKEYKGQRVVTFKDIDTLHQRPTGTAKKRFNDNKEHFIEGIDFFKVKCSEVGPFFGPTPPNGYNPHADIILLTESGYLMVVKSFTDDLAWKVQRQLINAYFRSRQIQQQNNYSEIDQTAIIMTIKELCEKNYEINEKFYNLKKENRELNKKIGELNNQNYECIKIIKILCEKMCGLYEKKHSRKFKSKKS